MHAEESCCTRKKLRLSARASRDTNYYPSHIATLQPFGADLADNRSSRTYAEYEDRDNFRVLLRSSCMENVVRQPAGGQSVGYTRVKS